MRKVKGWLLIVTGMVVLAACGGSGGGNDVDGDQIDTQDNESTGENDTNDGTSSESADGDQADADSADSDGDAESACTIYYRDDDGDGFGVTNDSKCLVGPSAPYTATTSGDCDDSNAAIHPGAPEIVGNHVDDNCDGQTDEVTYWQPCGTDDDAYYCQDFESAAISDFDFDNSPPVLEAIGDNTAGDTTGYTSGRSLSVSVSKGAFASWRITAVPTESDFRLTTFSFGLKLHATGEAGTTPFMGIEIGANINIQWLPASNLFEVTAFSGPDSTTSKTTTCAFVPDEKFHRYDVIIDPMTLTASIRVDGTLDSACHALPYPLSFYKHTMPSMSFVVMYGLVAVMDNLVFSRDASAPLVENTVGTICDVGFQAALDCQIVTTLYDSFDCIDPSKAGTAYCPALCGIVAANSCTEMASCYDNCLLAPTPQTVVLAGQTSIDWAQNPIDYSLQFKGSDNDGTRITLSSHTPQTPNVSLNDPFAYYVLNGIGRLVVHAQNDANGSGTIESNEFSYDSTAVEVSNDSITDLWIPPVKR